MKRILAGLRRRGFTLPEVLVTVAMIGILAAAVVPAVIGQLQKGDAGRVGDDIVAIRGAVETFASDVRKYPASVAQLTNSLTTTLGPFAGGGAGAGASYTSADVIHWKGPYLNKDSVSAITTAYGNSFTNTFSSIAWGAKDSTTGGAGTQKYLTLVLATAIDTGTARLIDRTYDDGQFGSGFIRCGAATWPAATCMLEAILVPVQ